MSNRPKNSRIQGIAHAGFSVSQADGILENVIPELTWSTKPTPLSFGKGLAYFTDLQSTSYSDGNSNWQPIVSSSVTLNTIIVDKIGVNGHFTSIKDAVDSITDATSTNAYVITVAPGIYIEDTIYLKPFVAIKSIAGELLATLIVANGPNKHIVVGAPGASLSGFFITGASGTGYCGIYYKALEDSLYTFSVNNVLCTNNNIDFHVDSDIFDTLVTCTGLTFSIVFDGTITNLKVSSSGTAKTIFGLSDLNVYYTQGGTNLSESIIATGINTKLFIKVVTMFNVKTAKCPGDGIVVQDGATIIAIGGSISGFNKNIVSRNIGSAPILQSSVNLSENSTLFDLSIEHPGTIGITTGSADKDKVFVDIDSPIVVSYTDTGTAAGTLIAGRLYFGPTHTEITDFTALLNESLPVGLLSGGTIEQGTNPLDINVSAGYGYISQTNDHIFLKKLSWGNVIFTLPDNAISYIYIDTAGNVARSLSAPDELTTISLGRLRTTAGVITFIAEIPKNSARLSSKLSTFARNAIGPIFKSGSSIVENATPFHINVGSGNYYYSDLNYLPSGGTNLNFYDWYQTSGTWTKSGLINLVNHTQYNNVTTGLVSLTASYYVKHSLYVSGDGVNEQYALVIGDAQYSTLLAAQTAPLVLTPSLFGEITIPIAAIIVQQGAANITEFIDIRPRIGFQNPSTSAATTHGNLLGLSADDHPQYLLANGTRAMSGSLNMNSNAISNVTTVNSVSIQTHQARHLPNGADPETTAAPLINISPITTNDVGTANSFSRSDHQHALTGVEATTNKDAAGGYAGLTLFKLNLKNAANTFTNFFTNATTAARTWTLPDKDGTIAMLSDVVPIATPFVTIGADATLTGERSLTGTANQITITDGGANSTVTLSISDNPILPGTGSVTLPIGTTGQRPSPVAGMVRYNSTTNNNESYNGSYWSRLGIIKQKITGQIAQQTPGAVTIPFDNTPPVISEGVEIWSQAIVPLSATNKIVITFSVMVDNATANRGIAIALFRDSVLLDVKVGYVSTNGFGQTVSMSYADIPGVTTSTVYSARAGSSGTGNLFINRNSADTFGGSTSSSYIIEEILP